jgi:hypothetical protein
MSQPSLLQSALTALLLISPTKRLVSCNDQHETRQAKWVVGQQVQTSSGRVQGQAASNLTEVSEYLGIPYGVAPIGNLRFQPPAKYSGTADLDGTKFVSDILEWGRKKKLYLTV